MSNGRAEKAEDGKEPRMRDLAWSDENWDGIVEIIEKAIEDEIERQIALGIDDDDDEDASTSYTPAVITALEQAGFAEGEIWVCIARYLGPTYPVELASFEVDTVSCGFPL